MFKLILSARKDGEGDTEEKTFFVLNFDLIPLDILCRIMWWHSTIWFWGFQHFGVRVHKSKSWCEEIVPPTDGEKK